MFEDYLMDQITDASRALAKLVFHKRAEAYALMDEQGAFTEPGLFWHSLRRLILQGEINEAENMLFEKIKEDVRPEYLEIALSFYKELLNLDEDFLAKNDFSRQEILEGLAEVKRIYDAG